MCRTALAFLGVIGLFGFGVGCRKATTPADAWSAYRSGRFQEASTAWREILEAQPLSGEAYLGLGLARLGLRDTVAAEHNLERASNLLSGKPQAREAYVHLSDLYLARHPDAPNYVTAVGHMADQLLGADPGSFDGHRLWGEAARLRAQHALAKADVKVGNEWLTKSLEAYQSADRAKPDQLAITLGMAKAHELGSDMAKAAESWERVLRMDSGNKGAYFRLLSIYERLGQPAQSAKILEAAIQRFPGDQAFLLSVAEKTLELNRLDLLPRAAEAITRTLGDRPKGHLELGRLFERAGMVQQAVSAYKNGEASDKARSVEYRRAAVRLLLRTNQLAEAASQVQDLKKKAPDHPATRILEAAVATRSGRADQAIAMLQTVLANNPAEVEASVELAKAYRERRELPLALATLRMCQRSFPEYVPALVELADLYLSTGDADLAERTAMGALSLNPNDREAQRILAATRTRADTRGSGVAIP